MDDFVVSDPERKLIFKALCEEKHLPFSAIQKRAALRSNKLSYHLAMMIERGFVRKREDGAYELSIEAQRLVPFFSQIFKKEVGALPVVLGIVRNGERVALIRRKKMPYKDHWGLFGGKPTNGETLPQAIEREVFEESRIRANFQKYNGIICEQCHESGVCKHTFLLILTTLTTEGDTAFEMDEGAVGWFDLNEVLAGKVQPFIPSDLMMLQRYAAKKMDIEHVVIDESDEKLTLKQSVS